MSHDLLAEFADPYIDLWNVWSYRRTDRQTDRSAVAIAMYPIQMDTC